MANGAAGSSRGSTNPLLRHDGLMTGPLDFERPLTYTPITKNPAYTFDDSNIREYAEGLINNFVMDAGKETGWNAKLEIIEGCLKSQELIAKAREILSHKKTDDIKKALKHRSLAHLMMLSHYLPELTVHFSSPLTFKSLNERAEKARELMIKRLNEDKKVRLHEILFMALSLPIVTAALVFALFQMKDYPPIKDKSFALPVIAAIMGVFELYVLLSFCLLSKRAYKERKERTDDIHNILARDVSDFYYIAYRIQTNTTHFDNKWGQFVGRPYLSADQAQLIDQPSSASKRAETVFPISGHSQPADAAPTISP